MTAERPTPYNTPESLHTQLREERVTMTSNLRTLLEVLTTPDSQITPAVLHQKLQEAVFMATRLEDINRSLGEDKNKSV